jgi:pimeloyl-ACP methyl ester carboxylesterase
VRGAGESDRPRGRPAYTMDHLKADLHAVIDDVSPDAPVHLLAHDWGSCQSWYALSHGVPPRVATYTSISGPSLAQGNRWIAAQFADRATWGRGLWQLAHSAYIMFFRMPGLPVAAIRLGLFDLVLRTDRSRRRTKASRSDAVSGLQLYRANMRFGRPRRRPARTASSPVAIPVQVIAPTRDSYVSVAMQTELGEAAPDLRVTEVDGGHWLPLSKPEIVARHVRSFIEQRPSLRVDEPEVSA